MCNSNPSKWTEALRTTTNYKGTVGMLETKPVLHLLPFLRERLLCPSLLHNHHHHTTLLWLSSHHIVIAITIIMMMMMSLRRWCWCATTLSATFLFLSTTTTILTLTQQRLQVHAWYKCPEDRGGGTCPDAATCCATATPGISSCISEKEDEYVGVCCTDGGIGSAGVTGCDHNYVCARSKTNTNTNTSSQAEHVIAATSITSTHSLSSKDQNDMADPNEGDDDDNILPANNEIHWDNKHGFTVIPKAPRLAY